MLGDKRILAEIVELKKQIRELESFIARHHKITCEQVVDQVEKLLADSDKMDSDVAVDQFMGENGLYSYKTLEDKLKDKYLKQHN